jgi:hypothetical protein
MSSPGKGGCLCQRWYSNDFASHLYCRPAEGCGCLRCQVAMVSCSVRSVAAASVIDPDRDCERRHSVQRWMLRLRDQGRPTAGFVTAELRDLCRAHFEKLAQGRGALAPRSVAENAATAQAVREISWYPTSQSSSSRPNQVRGSQR